MPDLVREIMRVGVAVVAANWKSDRHPGLGKLELRVVRSLVVLHEPMRYAFRVVVVALVQAIPLAILLALAALLSWPVSLSLPLILALVIGLVVGSPLGAAAGRHLPHADQGSVARRLSLPRMAALLILVSASGSVAAALGLAALALVLGWGTSAAAWSTYAFMVVRLSSKQKMDLLIVRHSIDYEEVVARKRG